MNRGSRALLVVVLAAEEEPKPRVDELRGVVRFLDGSPVAGIRIKMYCEANLSSRTMVGSAHRVPDTEFRLMLGGEAADRRGLWEGMEGAGSPLASDC